MEMVWKAWDSCLCAVSKISESHLSTLEPVLRANACPALFVFVSFAIGSAIYGACTAVTEINIEIRE